MFRKIIFALSFIFVANTAMAYSVENPAYVDIQPFISVINYKLSYLKGGVTASGVTTTGVNFHVAIGYDFTSHLAAELGMLWAFWPIYKNVLPKPLSILKPVNKRVKNNVLYLAGKFGWSIWRFQMYAKGGISSVARQGFFVGKVKILTSRLIVTPIVGVGTLFQITPHWSLDVTWFHVFPRSNYQLPASNFFAFGGMYRFRLI